MGLPDLYDKFREHAALAEEIDPDGAREVCFFAIAEEHADWPFLVVAQSSNPPGFGSNFGALLVEETDRLFIGADERVLAYDLSVPRRLWEDRADCGFWSWDRYGGIVVMSAEIEMAAWDLSGRKLWTTFVEPPWFYHVADGMVTLDVMGNISDFDLRTGPPVQPR